MEFPFVDIHTHHQSDADCICVYSYLIGNKAETNTELHNNYSVGIHPWDAKEQINYNIASQFAHLQKAPTTAAHLIAIGEIGLDFAMALLTEDRAIQEKVFRAQLDLADDMNMPVIIHCVRAYNELISILKEHSSTPIIHGFIGSVEIADQLLNIGCYLSFGEAIFTSPKTVKALKMVPSERVFLETDQSELKIESIYRGVSTLTGYTLAQLKEQIYYNYSRVFKQ